MASSCHGLNELSKTAIENDAWMNNYIPHNTMDETTFLCPNLNLSLLYIGEQVASTWKWNK